MCPAISSVSRTSFLFQTHLKAKEKRVNSGWMSKSAINGSAWAEMSEAQKIEAVRERRATLKEAVEGLLDGPDKLRKACAEFLTHTDACFKELPDEIETDHSHFGAQSREPQEEAGQVPEESTPSLTQEELMNGGRKRRLGLPKGYVPRLYRH